MRRPAGDGAWKFLLGLGAFMWATGLAMIVNVYGASFADLDLSEFTAIISCGAFVIVLGAMMRTVHMWLQANLDRDAANKAHEMALVDAGFQIERSADSRSVLKKG